MNEWMNKMALTPQSVSTAIQKYMRANWKDRKSHFL